MEFTVIIPHFKAGKMTAYSIAQFLKYSEGHKLNIIVGDNNGGDGSTKYLAPFRDHITLVEYPKNKLQSHGVLIDYVLSNGMVSTPYFITAENDSFPTREGWLKYYESLIMGGYNSGASLLKLSGGTYGHPAGAFYKTSIWEEANRYCKSIDYTYFPNMSMREAFQCHLMIHNNILDSFLETPEDYIELADGYRPYSKQHALERAEYYSTVNAPFHNGMGGQNESVHTYGMRTEKTEVAAIVLNNKMKIINRIGYEPGQWFYYWQLAMGYKVFQIPTEVKWLPGKENQQQEYTLMENGFKHIWGVASYHGTELADADVAKVKQTLPEYLYSTLPEHQKINDAD